MIFGQYNLSDLTIHDFHYANYIFILKALDMYLMHSCVCCEFSRLVIFLLQPIKVASAYKSVTTQQR